MSCRLKSHGLLRQRQLSACTPLHNQTPRAKAGGKQSSKDASGKFARSAGSALRRYNEGALARDVAELLGEWAPQLAAADL